MRNQMARGKSLQAKRWDALVNSIIDALPSAEEKGMLLEAIDEIISFFSELRHKLAQIPTIDQTKELEERMQAFTVLFSELNQSTRSARF
jgi:hypothetical protein